MVRAKTVDLLVPAEAEWVIEGFIATDMLEPEAPFGESHGYVNLSEYNAFMDVTAITRRRDPVLTSFISQVTPSEIEHHQARRLRADGARPSPAPASASPAIKRVSMHEPLTSVVALIVLIVDRAMPATEVWRALYAASQVHRFAGRWVIAVNDDIDPENSDALWWAVCYRAQAQHDIRILDRKDPGHGPRFARDNGETASVLIDAHAQGQGAAGGAPQARIHGARARPLGRAGPARLHAGAALARLFLGFWPDHLEAQA